MHSPIVLLIWKLLQNEYLTHIIIVYQNETVIRTCGLFTQATQGVEYC